MERERAKAIVEALVKLRTLATDEQAVEVPVLYPAWTVETIYKVGERILYGGVLYKVVTGHTSQSDQTPDKASSLYSALPIPESNINT